MSKRKRPHERKLAAERELARAQAEADRVAALARDKKAERKTA
jgi:hypothetical protein